MLNSLETAILVLASADTNLPPDFVKNCRERFAPISKYVEQDNEKKKKEERRAKGRKVAIGFMAISAAALVGYAVMRFKQRANN